jgi:hypothetical protein
MVLSSSWMNSVGLSSVRSEGSVESDALALGDCDPILVRKPQLKSFLHYI